MTSMVCCVKSCNLAANLKTGCVLYLLPTTVERRNDWLERLDRSDLINTSDKEFYVCNNHFEPRMFQQPQHIKGIKKLKPDACPTRIKPKEPSTSKSIDTNAVNTNTTLVKKVENVTLQDLADPAKKLASWQILQNKIKNLEDKLRKTREEKSSLIAEIEKKKTRQSAAVDKILKHFKTATYLSIYKKDNLVFVYRNGNLVWEFKKDELKQKSRPVYRKTRAEASDEEEEAQNADNPGNSSEIQDRDEENEATPMEVKEEVMDEEEMDEEDENYSFPESVKMES